MAGKKRRKVEAEKDVDEPEPKKAKTQDDDAEMEDSKPTATAAAASKTPPPAAAKGKVAVSKLRMPSEQTPGNVQETTPLTEKMNQKTMNPEDDYKMPAVDPNAPETPQRDEGEEEEENGEPLSLYDRLLVKALEIQAMAKDHVEALRDTPWQETLQNAKEGGMTWYHSSKTKVWFWMLVGLAFHALSLLTPYSVYTSMVQIHLPLGRGYQSLFGSGTSAVETGSVYNETLAQIELKDMEEGTAKAERLVKQLTRSRNAALHHVKSFGSLQKQDSGVNYDAIWKSLQGILGKDADLKNPGSIKKIRSLLGGQSKYLLSFDELELWDDMQVEESICGDEESPDESAEEPIDDTKAQELLNDFDLVVGEHTETLNRASGEFVKSHFQALIPDIDPTRVVANAGATDGSSGIDVQAALHERMEIEKSDRVGKADYASILSGAEIIKTGKYRTSPSLVDTLPFVNRFLASTKLRHYGYGPEMAIRPVYPPTALGQCWSFLMDESGVEGAYATLSIRLAAPVYVTSVSVEHPPKEMSDRTKSAIRKFRVIGFENDDASGEPWDLGSFEYQLGREIIQEFDVNQETEEEIIPPLESLTIAIDSNWGMNYACLYRLRVHGEDDD